MRQEDLLDRLADRVVQRYKEISYENGAEQRKKRCIVALAGGPGSGKSTIGAGIADRVSNKGVKCQVVAMDGFMKHSTELTEEEYKRRGAIETFDAEKVVSMFQKLHEQGPGHEMWMPDFDEENWEPILNAQLIHADTEAIIFEGIYLLADQIPWSGIHDYVDEKWFISVELELARQRVAGRNVEKGVCKDMDEALKMYDGHDGLNNAFINKYRYHTDVIIESNEEMNMREPASKI